jgi:ABC-type nitrate/sulfonate/bicarbonate transport system substrate-binding protein
MTSNSKVSIKVVGVPEHFNFVWQLGIDSGSFDELGLEVSWRDECLGTGAMCKSLKAGEEDMAVLLTEGAVADILNGGPHRIIGVLVQSPLLWGVHVHATSGLLAPKDLCGKTFGVSRMGSGSHLMACVFALSQGWDPAHDLHFEVVGGLDGATKAMKEGRIDVYMWERLTTKHLVESGEWRSVTLVPTPWSPFVVTATNAFLAANPDTATSVMTVLSKMSKSLSATDAELTSAISKRYRLSSSDVGAWLDSAEYDCQPQMTEVMLRQVVNCLANISAISRPQWAAFHPAKVVSDITTIIPIPEVFLPSWDGTNHAIDVDPSLLWITG